MDRGAILNKAFLFPQAQQQVRQPRSRQQGIGSLPEKTDEYFGIPKAESGFQYTKGMRDKALQYYKDLAALRQFAREQWTVYGNDVMSPDPTREDSVMASEAFKAGIANIQFAADDMKVSQEMFAKDSALRNANEFQFAPGAFDQSYAEVAGTPEAGRSLKVDPLTQFVGEQAGKDFTSYGQYGQAKQAVQALQQSATDPRAQIAAGSITPDYSPRAEGGGSGTTSPVTGMVAEWGQLSAGRHPSFTVTEKATPEGSFWLKSLDNSFIGKSYGTVSDEKGTVKQFVISEIIHNPDKNETYAVNSAGRRKLLPQDISVSIKSALPSTSIAEYEKYVSELDRQGILPKVKGEGGAVTTQIPGSLFVPTTSQTQYQQEQLPAAQAKKEQVLQVKEKVSKDLDVLNSSFWNFKLNPFFSGVPDELMYKSDYGDVKVEGKNGVYTIYINGTPKRDTKENIIKFDKNKAQNFLGELNVYGAAVKDKNGDMVPIEQIKAKETDRASELIKKYSQ